MNKKYNMMEEIAHGLCDNYEKPNKPGIYQILTLMHHLPWTVVLVNIRGMTINFASTCYYFPDSSVSNRTAIIFYSHIQL